MRGHADLVGDFVGQQLQPFLRSLVRPGTDLKFDDLPIPYRAVATDFETGRRVVLDHGDLSIAVRASMSVPGAFAPVDLDGKLLVDGVWLTVNGGEEAS